jgi:hypothetical protein
MEFGSLADLPQREDGHIIASFPVVSGRQYVFGKGILDSNVADLEEQVLRNSFRYYLLQRFHVDLEKIYISMLFDHATQNIIGVATFYVDPFTGVSAYSAIFSCRFPSELNCSLLFADGGFKQIISAIERREVEFQALNVSLDRFYKIYKRVSGPAEEISN